MITRSYVDESGVSYNLNNACQRHYKRIEKDLGKKCHKLWSCVNRLGEQFIFGQYGTRKDPHGATIVTISQYDKNIYQFVPFH